MKTFTEVNGDFTLNDAEFSEWKDLLQLGDDATA
jgi:hypothetical protein